MQSRNSDVMRGVVHSLCERINTPRSLAVWICFSQDHEALLELPPAAITDDDTTKFQLDYLVTEYLTKYKGLKVNRKPRDVALDKWILAEQQCKETNKRFRDYRFRPFTGRVEAALYKAQRKIAAVLGVLNLPIVLADCKWGPGATCDIIRKHATPDKKMSQAISVTPLAQRYLIATLEADPHWAYCLLGSFPAGPYSLTKDHFKVVPGSRMTFVAKNAKTDRIIAMEPTGNSFLQQGVHSYLRRRLKRFGIDLDDQSINQKRAQDAFRQGLSTLDLSMASDTISLELVYHLLPLEWAFFLDNLRSHTTEVAGNKAWRVEKFASMGNAFTFELETLIFWALASSAVEVSGNKPDVTVYGDDIIIPRQCYDEVVEILTTCGFTVNDKKSFRAGRFYESCGKHYHMGIDVTPVYQKETLRLPFEVIRAHNRLIRLKNRILRDDRETIFAISLKRLANAYPLRPFPRIPYGVEEDGGFLRPLSEFTLDPNHGFRCHVLDYVLRHTEAREDAMYAYKLRRIKRRNPKKDGTSSNAKEGSWRSKIRWVPEHAIYPMLGENPSPERLLGLS